MDINMPVQAYNIVALIRMHVNGPEHEHPAMFLKILRQGCCPAGDA